MGNGNPFVLFSQTPHSAVYHYKGDANVSSLREALALVRPLSAEDKRGILFLMRVSEGIEWVIRIDRANSPLYAIVEYWHPYERAIYDPTLQVPRFLGGQL